MALGQYCAVSAHDVTYRRWSDRASGNFWNRTKSPHSCFFNMQRAASFKRLIADPALPQFLLWHSPEKVQIFQFCFIRKWFFRKSVSCQGLWHFLLHIWAISLSQGWRSSYMCMRARTHMDTHTTERMWFSAATRGYGGRKIPFMRSQEKKKTWGGEKKKKEKKKTAYFKPTGFEVQLKFRSDGMQITQEICSE